MHRTPETDALLRAADCATSLLTSAKAAHDAHRSVETLRVVTDASRFYLDATRALEIARQAHADRQALQVC